MHFFFYSIVFLTILLLSGLLCGYSIPISTQFMLLHEFRFCCCWVKVLLSHRSRCCCC